MSGDASSPKVYRHRLAKLVPWCVLAVGLATTAMLYATIGRNRREHNRQEFVRTADRMVREIDEALAEQIALLHATAGVLESKPEFNQADFANYYRHIQAGNPRTLPATLGISLVAPWRSREELSRQARLRGVASFEFRPLTPRTEAHAVILVQPLLGRNLLAAGYDMHTDPIRRVAMDRARDEGVPALTTKTTLRLDVGHSRPAVLLYLPLFDRAQAGSVAERRTHLRGFVFSGLRAEDLFRNLKNRLEDDRIGIDLYTESNTPGNRIMAFDVPSKTAFRLVRPVRLSSVSGTLIAEFVAGADFGYAGTIQPVVPPVGIAISLLLFALATMLQRAHEQSSRREDDVRLLAEVGRLSSDMNEEAVLDHIAQMTAQNLDGVCRIDLIERDGAVRTINTRKNAAEALMRLEAEYPRQENDLLLRKAFETGVTQHAEGYLAVDEGHQTRLDALDVGPIVIVPMHVRERILGAITITRRKGRRPLTRDALALVESIAGRMALAIDNGRLYQAVQRENEELERRVAERTRDLEASNHELESFCYSVSHDLRTPLRSLDGFGRALQEDYGSRLDAQGIDYIERIRAATKRMDELITALLTLSRLTRSEISLRNVDVSLLISDLMHDRDRERRVDWVVQEGLSVYADPRMTTVVFENLLENAIKFSSKTERPRIEVGRTPEGAIFVRDNGAGFDPQYASKLFQPFERLHSVREFPGHGIGLATVERILRRHGGDVRAEGKPGEGATFYVCFPQPS